MNAIRYYRKNRGLWQYELATKVGITNHSLNLMEMEKKQPSPKTLAKISKALHIPAGRLFQIKNVK